MHLHLEKKKLDYGAYPGTSLDPLPHFHTHLELILMEKGKSIAIAGQTEQLFEEGDLFISFPNQIHFYHDILVPQVHQVIYLSPNIVPEFTYEFTNQLPSIAIYKNAINNPKILSAFKNIYEICRSQNSSYANTELKGHALILFSEIFRCIPLDQCAPSDSTILETIIQYCHLHYTEDISLSTLADDLYVNQFYKMCKIEVLLPTQLTGVLIEITSFTFAHQPPETK